MKSLGSVILNRRQMISVGLGSLAAFGLSACGGGSSQSDTAAATATKPTTYGEPWLTSIVDGMVTADLERPELKDDLYLNVNYEWLRDTAIPADQDGAGGQEDVLNIVNERYAELCTDESITGPEAEMVREYYQMHLDWDTRAQGKEFFLEHLKPIQDIDSLEGLSAYLGSEESLSYGAGMLKGLVVDKHLERPDEWMLRIRITPLDFDDSGEYAEEAAASSLEADCANYVLQYAGYNEEEAAKLVEQCYAFERLLNSSSTAAEEAYASDAKESTKTFYSREELAEASPKFPLGAIVDSFGYNPELDINLQQPWWLEAINDCCTEDNVPLVRAYLLCHYAGELISSLDEDCYRKGQQLKVEYGEMNEPRADEYYAVKDASFELSNFVDQMYVEKYCSEKMRQDIKGLVKEVIAEYREMLQNETWLSAETREMAIRKLDAIRLYAVYPDPDERQDWSYYHFTSRADGGNYLTAYREIRRCALERERKKSYSPPDPKIWNDSASDVNAFFDPSTNSMYILAGLMNGSFYREDMTREEMLGSICMTIGHEISHGFDAEGSGYDETGALKDWWTESDKAAFERRSEKLVRYYDSLHPWMDGSTYSGELVQTEAVADLGGMACILRMAAKTPDFDYDAFFRSNAVHWCAKYRERHAEKILKLNERPLEHLRVNVVAAQFPEFQETYGIQPGDGMYVAPEDRIAIWGMPDNTTE